MMRVREPVQFIPYVLRDLAKLGTEAYMYKSGSGAQDPVQGPNSASWKSMVSSATIIKA